MYVMDVIRKVDRLYPNEFTLYEKISWIDELNAKLRYEYAKDYGSISLSPDTDGTYLLPEWLRWEDVHSIRMGKREIKKENFTTYGVKILYGYDTRIYLPVNSVTGGELTVIYLIPAKKIRVINLKSHTIDIIPKGFYILKTQFKEGDVINIKGTVDGGSIDTDLYVLKDCELANITEPENMLDTLHFFVECSGLEEIAKTNNSITVDMERRITDKTICSMPYDNMYIEWVAGKICYWQKNFSSYNQHMTAFNQYLSDFSHYIMERQPSTDNTQFTGWMK